MPALSRNAAIVLVVLLMHVGLIWVFYAGLLTRAPALVVPVVALSQFIEPPEPKPKPKPVSPTKPLPLPWQPKVSPPLPTPQPFPPSAQIKESTTLPPAVTAPLASATADPTPAADAPIGVTTPPAVSGPDLAAVAAPVASPPATPLAPASLQLPSSDADYLQNPRPLYPAISRRLNEHGKTMVRVLIGIDGQPQRAEISKSSGFARLDEAALTTVMRWRFVPGKRGGVAETMWFNVPINWVLE